MAITGIDTIEGKQIIAAGSVSAKSAEMAYNDENGNPITGYLTAVPESSLSGYIPYSAYGISLINSNFSIDINGQAYKSSAGQPDQQINVTYTIGNMYLNDNNDGFTLQAGKYEFRVTLSGVKSLKITTALGTEVIEVVNGIGIWNLATDYTTRFLSDSVVPYESNDGTGTRLYFYSSADATLWYVTSEATNKPYALIDDLSGKQDISGMTAYQPVGNYQTAGDYLTTADSANFYTTANESGFITGVDLTPYQTIEGMTAYQPVGDYASATDLVNYQPISSMTAYANSADVTGTAQYGLTTAGWSEITGGGGTVPTGIMVESGLEYDANNKISGYSGSAFAGGTELEFEYDAADNISAINNSAISTTPAQALYAQNPLYFSATGTSSYMGINSADLARMLGVDETVLFETTANNSVVTASESVYNFDMARFYMKDDNQDYAIIDLPACISANRAGNYMPFGSNGDTTRLVYVQNNGDGIVWSADGKQKINSSAYSQIGNGYVFIKKIVGVHRISD